MTYRSQAQLLMHGFAGCLQNAIKWAHPRQAGLLPLSRLLQGAQPIWCVSMANRLVCCAYLKQSNFNILNRSQEMSPKYLDQRATQDEPQSYSELSVSCSVVDLRSRRDKTWLRSNVTKLKAFQIYFQRNPSKSPSSTDSVFYCDPINLQASCSLRKKLDYRQDAARSCFHRQFHQQIWSTALDRTFRLICLERIGHLNLVKTNSWTVRQATFTRDIHTRLP